MIILNSLSRQILPDRWKFAFYDPDYENPISYIAQTMRFENLSKYPYRYKQEYVPLVPESHVQKLYP